MTGQEIGSHLSDLFLESEIAKPGKIIKRKKKSIMNMH